MPLSTPALVAFVVLFTLTIWGGFLAASLLRMPAGRWKALFNFGAMVLMFGIVSLALWAITHGWASNVYEKRLFAFLLVFSSLGLLGAFLAQCSLWCEVCEVQSMHLAKARPVVVGGRR